MDYRIHPGGIPAQCRDGSAPFLHLLRVRCPQPAGKWPALGAHLARPQAALPHVLLPFSPGHH